METQDEKQQYSQHEVLFPAGLVSSHRYGCAFNILDLQCDVNIKLVCKIRA